MKNIENPPLIRAFVKTFTRVKGAASGDVAYNGVGFKPKTVLIVCRSGALGVGFSLGIENMILFVPEGLTTVLTNNDRVIDIYNNGSGGRQSAIIKSLDSDGFTLTWTLGGVGCADDIECKAICFR